MAGLPLVQELGKLEWRFRALFELALDGPPVSGQYFPPGGGRYPAGFDVEQQVNFPTLETIAGDAGSSQIVHQAAELVQHRILVAT